jgi:predicted amidohydrolase
VEELVEGAPEGSLVVFPELALTGYGLGARTHELALTVEAPPPLAPPGSGRSVLFGFPESARDGRVFNAAGVVTDRGWELVHRKRYLPTYGAFQEGRFFAQGDRGPAVFHPAPGWVASVLVCEELWHPALPWLAALQGADLLVVMAAAPGRGPVLDPEESGPRFGSWGRWQLLARSAAMSYGMYVVVCNRAGTEGGVVFAGGSMVVDPTGRVVAAAPPEGEWIEDMALDREAVTRARRPFSHLRDDDPRLVLRELRRLLDDPVGRYGVEAVEAEELQQGAGSDPGGEVYPRGGGPKG